MGEENRQTEQTDRTKVKNLNVIAMKKNEWTEDEDRIILTKYKELGQGLTSVLNRSWNAILKRASYLGVARRKQACDRKVYRVDEHNDELSSIEEFEKRNRELIKSLSFRNQDNSEGYKPKIKLYY